MLASFDALSTTSIIFQMSATTSVASSLFVSKFDVNGSATQSLTNGVRLQHLKLLRFCCCAAVLTAILHQLPSEELSSHEAEELRLLPVTLANVESISEVLPDTDLRRATVAQQLIFEAAENGVTTF